MPDINTVIAKITDALNEAYAVAGTPSLAEQLAAAQAQVTALTTERDALAAKVQLAIADAQARKAADAAKVDGQDLLDALGAP